MKVTIEMEERDAGYLKDEIEAHIQDCNEGISELEEKMAERVYERKDACMMALYRSSLKFLKRILEAVKGAKR